MTHAIAVPQDIGWLESLFDLSSDPMCMLGRDGRPQRVNPALVAALGHGPDELCSAPLLEHVVPADRAAMASALAGLGPDGGTRGGAPESTVEFAARCLHQDGTVRRLAWRARAVPGQGLIVAVARERTEVPTQPPMQLPAEPDLQDKGGYARLLAENVPVLVAYYDAEQRLRYGNAAYEAWTALPLADSLGKRREEILPPQDLADTARGILPALDGTPQRISTKIAFGDGVHRTVLIDYVPHLGRDGSVRGVLVVATDLSEQARTQEELHRSEAKFRALAEGSIQGLLVHRDGRVVFANAAFAVMVGQPGPEAVVGTEISHYWAPEEYERLEGIRQARLAGGDAPKDYVFRAQRTDGSRRWLQAINRVVDWDGSAAVQGIFVDVTERVEAEAGLRESQRLLRSVFDAVPEQIFVKDLEGRYLIANRQWAGFFGVDPDDCARIATAGLPNQPPEVLAVIRAMDAEVLRSGHPQTSEVLMCGLDGRMRTYRTVKAPLWGDAGTIVGICGFSDDITERVEAEQRLRESQRLLRNVFDIVPQQIFVKDLENRYLMVNRTFGEVTGIDPERCGDYTTATLPTHDPEFTAGARDMDAEVLRTGQPQVRERSLPGLDGRDRVQRTFKAPLRDDGGHAVGIVGYSEDITELLHTAQNLEQSRQLLQDVIDTVPHAIFVKDPAGKFSLVNRAFADFQGMAPEDLIGRTTADIFRGSEALIERLLVQDDRVWTEGRTLVEPEVPLIDAAGNPVIHHIYKLPLLAADGTPRALVAISEDVTASVKAREALSRSESRTKAILDAIPDLMFVLSGDGLIVDFHAHSPEMLAQTPEQFLGKPVSAALPSAAGARITDLVARVVRTGTLQAAEYELDLPAGPMTFEARMVPQAEGQVLAIVRDVTAARTAERDLRASQALLRTIFDAIPFPIAFKDRQSRFVMINRTLADVFGTTPEAKVGQLSEASTFGDQADRDQIAEADCRVLASGATVDLPHLTLQRADGSLRAMRVIKVPYRGPDAEIAGIVTLGVDTTELREAEQRLRDSEERFRQTVENIPSAIFLKDRQGVYRLVNRGFEQLSGLTREQMLGRTAQDLFPEQAAQYEALDRAVLESGQVATTEIALPAADGETRSFMDTKFPMHDAQGAISGIGVILTDVTAQRRTETQLRQAQKMEAIGQLAGGVAHDFNNILQIIAGYTGTLLRRADLPTQFDAPLREVERAAQRAAELTRKLLAFGRQQTLQLDSVDLNALVSEQMQMVRRVLSGQVHLELRLNPTPLWVHGDPGALEQVLLNLCINARDAMPGGGELVIETAPCPAGANLPAGPAGPAAAVNADFVCVTVRDTGHGMAADVRERIFDPFFTTKEVGQGSGLGLAMVYGIVAEHHGQILVESTPAVGTTFRIFLPATDQAPSSAPAPVQELPTGGNARILIAEDEPNVRRLLQAMLEDEGYTVQTVADGAEALALLSAGEHRFDLLVLDMIMPVMDGREAFEQIRARGIDLPVIFSTGYDAKGIDETLLSQPNVHLIQKPYNPDLLYRAVHQALDRA